MRLLSMALEFARPRQSSVVERIGVFLTKVVASGLEMFPGRVGAGNFLPSRLVLQEYPLCRVGECEIIFRPGESRREAYLGCAR